MQGYGSLLTLLFHPFRIFFAFVFFGVSEQNKHAHHVPVCLNLAVHLSAFEFGYPSIFLLFQSPKNDTTSLFSFYCYYRSFKRFYYIYSPFKINTHIATFSPPLLLKHIAPLVSPPDREPKSRFQIHFSFPFWRSLIFRFLGHWLSLWALLLPIFFQPRVVSFVRITSPGSHDAGAGCSS